MSQSTLESLLRQLEGLSPCAFQAQWDGDSRGWMVVLAAVVADEEGYATYPLEVPRLAGADEARHAAELGEALARHHGVPFWFPSPHHPDLESPNWWERDGAIPCPQCGKAIVPVHSEICSACDAARAARERLRSDGPDSPHLVGVHLIDDEGEIEATRHSAPELNVVVRVVLGDATWAATMETDGEIMLGPEALETIAVSVRDEIGRRIAALPEDDAPAVPRPHRRRLIVEYEGRRLDLDVTHPGPGWHLRCEIESLAQVELAIAGSMRLWLVSRRGLTARGDHVIRVLRHLGGAAALDAIVDACSEALAPGEIEAALAVITSLGYARVEDDRWSLTRKGRVVF